MVEFMLRILYKNIRLIDHSYMRPVASLGVAGGGLLGWHHPGVDAPLKLFFFVAGAWVTEFRKNTG